MRVLAADGLDKKAIHALEAAGHEVRLESGLDEPSLVEALPGVEVLVVRSATKVRKKALEAAAEEGSLRLVIRAGSGLDSIDVGMAESLGIRVTNTPGLNADGVAELALGLMFAVARKIGHGHAGMLEGRWEKKACKGVELAGRRLGVVGLGTIGSKVARLGAAVGMEVIGTRRTMIPRPEDPPLATLPEVVETCDVVSLHVPKSEGTVRLLSSSMLGRAKRGQILINTARGDVVDLDGVHEQLEAGRLGGFGVDVYPTEPPESVHPALRHPNVVATPHVGAQTAESAERIGRRVVQLVEELGARS
jgi:D-3-phosphoglycerate dehydrogenase